MLVIRGAYIRGGCIRGAYTRDFTVCLFQYVKEKVIQTQILIFYACGTFQCLGVTCIYTSTPFNNCLQMFNFQVYT